MASVNLTNIIDVKIDFQSDKMFYTLPKGSIEVIVLANCDWDRCKL